MTVRPCGHFGVCRARVVIREVQGLLEVPLNVLFQQRYKGPMLARH